MGRKESRRMAKIAPSARLREEIAAFLEQAEGSESGASALSRLVQLATARLVQEALEEEQTDFIGRERYAREAGRGKRNAYVPGHLDTAEESSSRSCRISSCATSAPSPTSLTRKLLSRSPRQRRSRFGFTAPEELPHSLASCRDPSLRLPDRGPASTQN
jgi:hypothetical protein